VIAELWSGRRHGDGLLGAVLGTEPGLRLELGAGLDDEDLAVPGVVRAEDVGRERVAAPVPGAGGSVDLDSDRHRPAA
jgi:hypothetical protein